MRPLVELSLPVAKMEASTRRFFVVEASGRDAANFGCTYALI